jgi:hypothetical protein
LKTLFANFRLNDEMKNTKKHQHADVFKRDNEDEGDFSLNF